MARTFLGELCVSREPCFLSVLAMLLIFHHLRFFTILILHRSLISFPLLVYCVFPVSSFFLQSAQLQEDGYLVIFFIYLLIFWCCASCGLLCLHAAFMREGCTLEKDPFPSQHQRWAAAEPTPSPEPTQWLGRVECRVSRCARRRGVCGEALEGCGGRRHPSPLVWRRTRRPRPADSWKQPPGKPCVIPRRALSPVASGRIFRSRRRLRDDGPCLFRRPAAWLPTTKASEITTDGPGRCFPSLSRPRLESSFCVGAGTGITLQGRAGVFRSVERWRKPPVLTPAARLETPTTNSSGGTLPRRVIWTVGAPPPE